MSIVRAVHRFNTGARCVMKILRNRYLLAKALFALSVNGRMIEKKIKKGYKWLFVFGAKIK